MCTLSNRDPYPFQRNQNDNDFLENRSQQVAPKTNSWTIYKNSKEEYGVPVHIAQTQDPWNRLNSKPTLTSSRREIYHHDPQAPNDSLDFILKATYNHHKELLKNENETLFQIETILPDISGRKLKNREKIEVEEPLELNHPLRITPFQVMKDINSIKTAIEWAHSEETNPGYSRKGDGGFFVF